MSKFKITRRDVVFFLLGIFLILSIDTIVNWQEYKSSFIKGFNGTPTEAQE